MNFKEIRDKAFHDEIKKLAMSVGSVARVVARRAGTAPETVERYLINKGAQHSRSRVAIGARRLATQPSAKQIFHEGAYPSVERRVASVGYTGPERRARHPVSRSAAIEPFSLNTPHVDILANIRAQSNRPSLAR